MPATVIRKPLRPAKDIKPGDLRSQTLENKGRTPRPARDIKPGDLRSKTLENKGITPRNPKSPQSTGTKTSPERMSGTQKSYKSRFKPPAVRKSTEVTVRDTPSSGGNRGSGGSKLGSVLGRGLGAAGFYFGDTFSSKTGNQANYGEKEELAKGLGPVMKGNAKYEKPIGPKVLRGASGTYTKPYDEKRGTAGTYTKSYEPKRGTAGTYTKPYDEKRGTAGTFTKSYDVKRGAAGTYTKPYDEKRGTAGTYTKSYDVKPKASGLSDEVPPKTDKQASGSKPVRKAGDKSRVNASAPKMTSFQQMKARQYEKEGYGGRSMTAAQARALVQKESGYKNPLSGLTFGSKAKAALKPASSASKAVKQGSTSTFASKMQGRNVPGSPTYSPTKAKSGFKFSDIFNRKK